MPFGSHSQGTGTNDICPFVVTFAYTMLLAGSVVDSSYERPGYQTPVPPLWNKENWPEKSELIRL